MLFWDASALVKAYVIEQGTPGVQAALRRSSGRSALTYVLALEVLAALAKRFRSKDIRKQVYDRARAEFMDHYSGAFKRIEISPNVVQTALDLAQAHRHIGVGAMDILHVASAMHAQASIRRRPVVVASSDAGMLRLAEECGLRTFDPEVQPLAALMASLN